MFPARQSSRDLILLCAMSKEELLKREQERPLFLFAISDFIFPFPSTRIFASCLKTATSTRANSVQSEMQVGESRGRTRVASTRPGLKKRKSAFGFL
jgi:hypothetical protein